MEPSGRNWAKKSDAILTPEQREKFHKLWPPMQEKKPAEKPKEKEKSPG